MTEFQITNALWPQPFEPTVTFGQDATRLVNNLEKHTFQFAVALRYKDRQRTTVSPWSGIPIDSSSNCSGSSPNNVIVIDFTSIILTEFDKWTEIAYVDILVKIDNADFVLVESLPVEKWVYSQTYRFYNDKIYTAEDAPYTLLLASANSLLSKSLCTITDANSNTRTIEAGLVEGYANFVPDMDINITYTNSTIGGSGANIVIPFSILNNFYSVGGGYNYGQPVVDYGDGPVYGGMGPNFHVNDVGTRCDQRLPLGGFVFYLRGTKHYAITKQIVPTITLGCGDLTPTLAAFGNGVVDGSSTGDSPFNPCNNAYRAAIRQVMQNGVFQSECIIPNVPPGEYILCIASPWCWRGADVHGDGERFNLDNGLEYQKTDADVWRMDGVDGVFECRVTVLPGQTTVNVGSCAVVDLSYRTSPVTVNNTCIIKGNVVDNMGLSDSVDHDLKEQGIPAERQYVAWSINGAGQIATRSSHNGYFYFAETTPLVVGTSRVGVLGCTANPSIPNGVIPSMGVASFSPTNLTVIKEPGGLNFYDGNFNGVAALAVPGSPNFSATQDSKFFTIYNNNADNSEKLSTFIEGLIQDNGQGLGGINVIFEGTGRFISTGPNGAFKLRAWSDMAPGGNFSSNADNRSGALYYYNNSLCPISFIPDSVSINIVPFQPNQDYSLSHPFDVGIIQGTLSTTPNIVSGIGHLYSGKLGLIYIDNEGRSTAVCTDNNHMNIDIPFITEPGGNEGIPQITWTLNSPVPIPAVHRFRYYQIVRTPPKVAYQLWIPVSNVKYVLRYDENTQSAITTSYAANNAREIYLDIGTTMQKYLEDHTDSRIAYEFEPGDRVIIVKDDQGVNMPALFDLSIKGFYAENGDLSYQIVIDNLLNMPELKEGCYVVVYREVKAATDGPYYEIPGQRFEITDWDGPNPTHSVTTSTIPVGDVYYREIEWQTESGLVYRYRTESFSISDFYASEVPQLGRATFEDVDARQMERPTTLRLSNNYFPEGGINGSSMYEPLNFKQLDIEYGLIMKLVYISSVLIALCKNSRATSMYVNRNTLSQGGIDDVLMAQTEEILPPDREMYREWGTQNPESVVVREGLMWFYDARRNVFVGYSVNGLDDKTKYGITAYLYEKSNQLLNATFTDCPCGYDPRLGSVFFTSFGEKDGQTILHTTISLNEMRNMWESFWTFQPEYYLTVGMTVFVFSAGECWEQHVGKDYSTFMGVPQKFGMTIALNPDPTKVKTWLNLELHSKSRDWYSPEITNENGQESRIVKGGNWKTVENVQKAAFLFDINTPNVQFPVRNGASMRSDTLTIKLENDSIKATNLVSLSVWYHDSELTNPS